MKKAQYVQIYAQALFDLAQERASVDQVLHELELILQLQQEEPAIKNFFDYPLLQGEIKGEFLAKNLQRTCSETVLEFLRVLLKKGHFPLLPKILQIYQKLADEKAQRVRSVVTTAFPLDHLDLQKVADILGQHLKKQVVIQHIVNPAILGGLTIKADHLWIDASLQRQLDRLRRRLFSIKEKSIVS